MDKSTSCASEKNIGVSVETIPWGGQIDGKEVFLYRLRNRNGMEMTITNYGAIVQSIIIPDGKGNTTDVVLGYDSLKDYVDDLFYMGAIVGRYSGRIAHGNITINGVPYQLTTTNGGYHHHGGKKGFNKMVWSASTFCQDEKAGVALNYISSDNEEGFPGNLDVTVIYSLDNTNEWNIEITARTDRSTVLNLTQHSYFNLKGFTGGASTILDHLLTIHTEFFLPVTESVLPTGKIAPVINTPLDFTRPSVAGERIDQDNVQLQYANGYDHSFVLKKENNDVLNHAATLKEISGGISMEVFTTEPSVHFYSGNFLESGRLLKYGARLQKHAGLCLETQHFSDSPNQPHFPSTQLEPGDVYRSRTVYRFSIPGSGF